MMHATVAALLQQGGSRLVSKMETSGQREERVLSAAAAEPYKAVVFGSTGAVGKEVVRALAESDKCGSVMAIVR